MSKTVTVQRFEIFGHKVSMGEVKKMTLTRIGNKKYVDQDDRTWVRSGPTYIREGGNEHGFMILC